MNPYVPIHVTDYWWAEPLSSERYYSEYTGFLPSLSEAASIARSSPTTSGFSVSRAPIPWLGIAAIVGAGAILIYGISRASKVTERIGGPIQEETGRLVGQMLRARGKGGAGKVSSRRALDSVIEGKLLSA
jgi:hypothetical protein